MGDYDYLSSVDPEDDSEEAKEERKFERKVCKAVRERMKRDSIVYWWKGAKCGQCRHVFAVEKVGPDRNGLVEATQLECRARPPQADGRLARWPKVSDGDWCAQFSENTLPYPVYEELYFDIYNRMHGERTQPKSRRDCD